MKIRTPDYYDRFQCIAGDCEDTCCAGWQVDVDDDSFAYYKTITGTFGDYLHSVMIEPTKKAEGQFRIRENGRCPFLNDRNLCDLYTELGEEALCVTCDQYPRYTTEYGNLRETGIALSCKTAAELILGEDRTPGFTEYEDPDCFPSLNDIDGTRYLYVMKARELAYAMLTDRSYTIWDRLILVLEYANRLQGCMKKPQKMDEVMAEFAPDSYARILADVRGEVAGTEGRDEEIKANSHAMDCYDTYFCHYLKQTIIKKEWPQLVEKVYRELYELPAPWTKEYAAAKKAQKKMKRTPDAAGKTRAFLNAYPRGYEYECLAMYFTFRYFGRSILDGDLLTKVKMGVVSILLILQCDAAKWYEAGASLSFSEQVDITHLYSREVEHSEENFAALSKLMATKKEFSVQKLEQLLSQL